MAAAGDIRAGACDRNDAVAERHAGKRLHLDVSKGQALSLRELAHLRLREADVLYHGGGHGLDDLPDLVLLEAEALALPAGEAGRPLPHGRGAPLADARYAACACSCAS